MNAVAAAYEQKYQINSIILARMLRGEEEGVIVVIVFNIFIIKVL